MPSLEVVEVPEEVPAKSVASKKESTRKEKRKITPAFSNEKKRKGQTTLGNFFVVQKKQKKNETPSVAAPALEEPPVKVKSQLEDLEASRKSDLLNIVVGRRKVGAVSTSPHPTATRLFDSSHKKKNKEELGDDDYKKPPAKEEPHQVSATAADADDVMEIDAPDKVDDADVITTPKPAASSRPTQSSAKKAPAVEQPSVLGNDIEVINTPNPSVSSRPAFTQSNAKKAPPAVEQLSEEQQLASTDVEAITPEPTASRATTASTAKKPSASTRSSATKSNLNTKPAATKPAAATESNIEELSDEAKSRLAKHEKMRETYTKRAKELLERSLPEESFDIPVAKTDQVFTLEEDGFPDACVPSLVSLLEGMTEPLSILAASIADKLNELYNGKTFQVDAVAEKIKILATRKHYIKSNSKVDIFEDHSIDLMWRWEVVVMDLLPSEAISKAKKARSARKKMSSHYNAISKLLQSLAEADLSIESLQSDKLLAKISEHEEKVLKFEREAEKSRLADESRLQKEAAKLAKQEEKHAAQQKKDEETRKKKAEAEEARRQKAAAKEEQLERERKNHEAQSKILTSFFTAPKKRAKSLKHTAEAVTTPASTFDAEAFRATILEPENKSVGHLSSFKRHCLRHRTPRIKVPVVVTVYPENYDEFGVEPYAEEQLVEILNKNKFLSFYEDIRPPYYGTWSKRSLAVTGRTPWGKDNTMFDYDNDSEAEWEEGDEVGEDIGDDKVEDDEEDEEIDGDNDGWLAADDEIDGSQAEGAHLIKNQVSDERKPLTVCYIAPMAGGKPIPVTPNGNATIQGFKLEEAFELLKSLAVTRRSAEPPCLDIVPPEDMETESENNNKAPMTDEQMKCFVRFVHDCKMGSKDKVVDELLKTHQSAANSRAQAFRTLDAVAEKKRDPCHGTYWKVKTDVLIELGLTELAEATVATLDDAKNETMRKMAEFVYENSGAASKEKMVDDFRAAHDSATGSRAEAMRLLQSIATKEKRPSGGHQWKVKASLCKQFGFDNSSVDSFGGKEGETAFQEDVPNQLVGPAATTQKDADRKALPTNATGRQKRSNMGQAKKLLAALVKKKKKQSS